MDEKETILIVDDDESTSRTLSLVFGRKGYDTETATTGQEAIEKAQERFFNLALLDIKLPDMEGVELLGPLKEMHPDMVMIMATAYASLETAVWALNEGASGYITKPLNMDEVLAVVREALEKQRLIEDKRQAEEALRVSHRFLEIANRHTEMIPLLKEFVVEAQNFTDCAAVGLRMLDGEGNIPYEAYEGFSRRFYELESPLSIKSDQCMCINVIKGTTDPKLPYYTEGGSFCMNGTTRLLATAPEEEKGPTRNVCNEFGYESVALVPIRAGGRILGLIHVADPQENMVPLERVELLEGAAMQLGTAIQRVRAEEALQASARQWRVTFDAISDGVWLADREGRMLRCNEAMTKLLGKPFSEIIGRPCWELVHGTSQPIEECPFKRMRETRRRETLVWLTGERWLDDAVDPLLDEDGNLVGAVHVMTDITDLKRAEEELRRHLERIEALREIDRAITSTLDLTEVLDIILIELARVIPYHSAAIFLLSDGTAKLTAGRGFPEMEHAFPVSFSVKEDPLTHELLQEERPLVLADAQADERFRARGGTEYVRSWMGVPLIAKGRAVGFLTIDHREPGVYDEEGAEMAQAFGSQVAIAIENARLYDESQRRAEEMAALREVSLATLSTLERDQVFEIMLDQLGTVIDYDTAAIKIITPDRRDKMIAGRGPVVYDQAMWNGFDEKDSRLVQEMKETGQPVVVHDSHTDERYEKVGDWEAFHSWVGAPLFVQGDMIGYLALEKTSPGFYDENAVQLLDDFARAAAIALEKARLYEDIRRELAKRERAEQELRQSYVKLERTLEGTVNTLVSAIEIRDPYTAGHQRRATQLACAIAREMGLPQEQVEGLRMAGLIHDIGKITIPAEILSKPGRLNDLEWGIIRAHPQAGYDILKTAEFTWPVAQIVRQHHERMDGSGYPQGLSGDNILVEARILAVADVVEAMASHRPYRPALGMDRALEEISQNRGVLYDPKVVDACLKLSIEKGFTFE